MSGRQSLFHSFCTDLRMIAFHPMCAEVRSILLSVLLSIVLTQAAWVGIYGCEVTRNVFLFDSGSSADDTRLADAIANASVGVLIIGAVSGVMLVLVIYDYKRVVKAWLATSSVCVTFVIAGSIFQDAAALLSVEQGKQVAIGLAATSVYGGGAVMAFFTQLLPARFLQILSITNCAAVATFYLTCLPGYTAWFLIAAVGMWESFVMLTRCGPNLMAFERAQDYDADILRFLMFATETEPPKHRSQTGAHKMHESYEAADSSYSSGWSEEEQQRMVLNGLPSDGDDDDYEDEDVEESEEEDAMEEEEPVVIHRPSKRLSAGADNQEQIREERSWNAAYGDQWNAREALDTGSHIGYGVIIFCSVLVGRSMAVGVLPALATTIGVLAGLAYTLSIPNETMPALPMSIACGMACHFITVAHIYAIDFIATSIF